jgi:hypothetical protein
MTPAMARASSPGCPTFDQAVRVTGERDSSGRRARTVCANVGSWIEVVASRSAVLSHPHRSGRTGVAIAGEITVVAALTFRMFGDQRRPLCRRLSIVNLRRGRRCLCALYAQTYRKPVARLQLKKGPRLDLDGVGDKPTNRSLADLPEQCTAEKMTRLAGHERNRAE